MSRHPPRGHLAEHAFFESKWRSWARLVGSGLSRLDGVVHAAAPGETGAGGSILGIARKARESGISAPGGYPRLREAGGLLPGAVRRHLLN